MAVHPLVRAQILAVGLLGTIGVPGLFSQACRSGDCCALTREQVLQLRLCHAGTASFHSGG